MTKFEEATAAVVRLDEAELLKLMRNEAARRRMLGVVFLHIPLKDGGQRLLQFHAVPEPLSHKTVSEILQMYSRAAEAWAAENPGMFEVEERLVVEGEGNVN